jgi:glycosyltransferase 2 family protein
MERPSESVSSVRHWPKLLFSLVLAVGFVWLLKSGGLPLVPAREAFANVNYWGVAAHVAIWASMLVVRAGRWYWLLASVQRVPMLTVLRAAFIGYVAIVVMPLRTGEVVRPLLIRREGKLSAWAATGTVGAERVIDGLVVTALLLLALSMAKPVEPLPDHIGSLPISAKLVPGAAYAFMAIFSVAFVLMALFYWWRDWARRASEALLGIVSLDLARWFAGRVEQVADGLGFLKDPKNSLPFFAGTLLYWAMNALSWWVLAHASGLHTISPMQACAAMGVLAIGISVPNTPGFFGAFQLSIYAGLAMYLPADQVVGAGAVFVFFTYVNQISVTLLGGAIAALLRPRAPAVLAAEP